MTAADRHIGQGKPRIVTALVLVGIVVEMPGKSVR
jgi:hypothetical protein